MPVRQAGSDQEAGVSEQEQRQLEHDENERLELSRETDLRDANGRVREVTPCW